MKTYKYRTLAKTYKYRNNDEWFESMHKEGWELVSPDFTRISNGYSSNNTQYYIFRKEIIECLPLTNINDKSL